MTWSDHREDWLTALELRKIFDAHVGIVTGARDDAEENIG